MIYRYEIVPAGREHPMTMGSIVAETVEEARKLANAISLPTIFLPACVTTPAKRSAVSVTVVVLNA